MRTAEFDFALPDGLIAQFPAPARDQARLLVLERAAGKLAHRRFVDLLDYLRPDDVLVLNDSRVIPARLRGRNIRTGGKFEALLLEENAANDWWAMLQARQAGAARHKNRNYLTEAEGPLPSWPPSWKPTRKDTAACASPERKIS